MLPMRMFVALVPPAEALEDLGDFLLPRQEAEPEFRWTVREQWHITLAFMASVEERHLDDLVERLGRAAARRNPFALQIAEGGAFPNPARARVLFAGVDVGAPHEELRRLATGARAAANKSGAMTKGGKFHPHLTLARLNRPAEVTRWVRVLSTYRGPTWSGSEIALIESHLGQGPGRRPRYEVVASFPLGK